MQHDSHVARTPCGGQIITRFATLGQTAAADGELYRVANLTTLSLSASLSPADAGLVHPGASIAVSAPGPRGWLA
jgi:cobalt-zinc-cadmium efflux system membrane fusion protein